MTQRLLLALTVVVAAVPVFGSTLTTSAITNSNGGDTVACVITNASTKPILVTGELLDAAGSSLPFGGITTPFSLDGGVTVTVGESNLQGTRYCRFTGPAASMRANLLLITSATGSTRLSVDAR
jgi:hypothetical protein